MVVAAALALKTERIKICSGVVNAYSRMPTVIGMAALTLSSLSRGRFILGIGSGIRHVGLVGGPSGDTPLRRLEETVAFIRQALDGGAVNFKGRVLRSETSFRLALAGPNTSIPIYVAALGPKAIRLAAGIGDGVVFHLFTKNYLERAVKIVREVRGSMDVACYLMTIVSDNSEEAFRLARLMIASYASIPRYAEHFRRMGFGKEVEEVQGAAVLGIEAAAEKVPDWMVDELAVYGRPARCAEKIAEYRELGISLPILYPYMRGSRDYPTAIRKTIELLAPSHLDG